MHVSLYVQMNTCICIYALNIYACIYIYIYICLYVNVYMYTCTDVETSACMHTNIHR